MTKKWKDKINDVRQRVNNNSQAEDGNSNRAENSTKLAMLIRNTED